MDNRTATQIGVIKHYIWDLGKEENKKIDYDQALKNWVSPQDMGREKKESYAKRFQEIWDKGIRNVMEQGKEPHYEAFEENRDWAFDVRRVPLVWIKEGGGFTDFDAKFMPRYEIVLFCNKGLRRLNSVCSDVLNFNRPLSVERIHTQQKPIDLLQLFIRLSSVPNEIVLDPCMGSGATNVAATLLGRRSIGIEKSEDNYNKAIEWIRRIDFEESGETNDIEK